MLMVHTPFWGLLRHGDEDALTTFTKMIFTYVARHEVTVSLVKR
jgi:hypothetical protein